MGGYRGIAIVLVVCVAVMLLFLISAFHQLGLQGMPVWYVDYPQAFARGHFMASVAAFALIPLTLAGLAQTLLLPRAEPEAEIFA